MQQLGGLLWFERCHVTASKSIGEWGYCTAELVQGSCSNVSDVMGQGGECLNAIEFHQYRYPILMAPGDEDGHRTYLRYPLRGEFHRQKRDFRRR